MVLRLLPCTVVLMVVCVCVSVLLGRMILVLA